MAKRFIDTEIFKKKSIRSMKAAYKLLWLYILNDCNHAGIWEVDFEVAQLRLDVKLNEKEALKIFEGKIKILNGGSKWFIPDFITFQYGELKENNKAHKNIISLLKKENLIDDTLLLKKEESPFENISKPLGSPLEGAKEMEMEMDMEKEMEKEQEMEKEPERKVIYPFMSERFLNAWQAWKDYKKTELNFKFKGLQTEQIALKHLSEMSGNDETTAIQIIQQAIGNNWKGLFPLKDQNGKKTLEQKKNEYAELDNTLNQFLRTKNSR